jgi:integrase
VKYRTASGHWRKRVFRHPWSILAVLRHTCASLLIAAGAHPKLIQARLGHSSTTTTLDRYGHLFPGVEEALADALDATFNDASTPTPLRQAKS